MNTATTQQIRQARSIITTLPHYTEEVKNAAVMEISDGRTEHMSELCDLEMRAFILTLRRLQGKKPKWKPTDNNCTKMQRKIIAMAHEIGWHYPSPNGDGLKIDMKKINEWCEKNSYLHKSFNRYAYSELPRLVAQFEEMHRYYLKNLNK